MRMAFTSLFAVLLVLAVLVPLGAQEEPAAKPKPEDKKKEADAGPTPEMMLEAQKYFPMAKGNWWEYKMQFESSDDMPVPPEEILSEVPRLEVSEITKNGCRIKPAGDSQFGVFMPSEVIVKDGFILQDMLDMGSKMKVLKLPPKKGDKWTSSAANPADPNETLEVQHSVGAVETVETPAGKFSGAVRVVSRFNIPQMGPGSDAMGITITMWYAPGVGLVKQVFGSPMGSVSVVLKKFHVKSTGDKAIAAAAKMSELVVIASLGEGQSEEGRSADPVDRELAGKAARELARRRAEKIEKGETVKFRLVVERVLKGRLKEKEIIVCAKQEIAEGEWLLFLGKLDKEGFPLAGPILPAQEEIIKKMDAILNPPKPRTLAEMFTGADFVIMGKAIVKEDRGAFSYWVFKIEKLLKGDTSRSHLDVLLTEGMLFFEGERYILILKAGRHYGRRLYELVGTRIEKYSKEKLQEYEEALDK